MKPGLLAQAGKPERTADPDNTTGGKAATPKEQALYERTVANGLNVIFDEKMFTQILKRIELSIQLGDPIEGIAAPIATVMGRIEKAASEAGQSLSRDLLLQAGTELLEALADAVATAEIHDYSEQELEGAVFRAVDMFRQQKQVAGDLDPERYRQELSQLAEADRRGDLERQMPGLREHFSRGGNRAQRRAAKAKARKGARHE